MEETVFTMIETSRLILRHFNETDLDAFLSYLNDPLVARYQTWESYSEHQARVVINEQKGLQPGVPGKWFTFAVEIKETSSLIGHIALSVKETHDELVADAKQAEIGFTFARQYQGRGLAKEAVECVLEYAFTQLSMHRVTAITDCENERSVALLSRLGMRREGHFIENIWFKGHWGSEYLYALLQKEWLSRLVL